jgi:hypothetical protein
VRVGRWLLRLLAAVALVAGSVAAASALLSQPAEELRAALPPPAPASKAKPPDPARSPATDESESAAEAENPPTERPPAQLLRAGATASWDALAGSVPARIGIAVAPLGRGNLRTFGTLQSGDAWSSIKVPILVTLMRDRDGQALSAEEERWAEEALTASDNEAGAALFGQLEDIHGGLTGASLAVQGILRSAGDNTTVVATEPPPPGAVSTYGQTDWSLPASVEFFRALGRGCLLDREGTAYVLGLMEEVIPEQRWGLGAADFPSTWQVGMKGGWGPEGSESGPYLVRQSGVVRNGGAGLAVTMIALADSGSFESGVEALNQIAVWLSENLRGLGPAIETGC